MRTVVFHHTEDVIIDIHTISDIEEACLKKGFTFIEAINNTSTSEVTVPYLAIGAYKLKYPFSRTEFERILDYVAKSSSDQQQSTPIRRLGHKKPSWIYRNYLWFISGMLVLFIGIPFLAPILMHNGGYKAAEGIYKVYSVLCHQLAFRSYFLYGGQIQYPRQLARVPGVLTYEQITGKNAEELDYAREFTGSEKVGFKVAICERDIAIYGSMAIFGIFFQLTRRKIKPLPWYLWVIVAIIPIGLDGGSQLPGLASGWPTWLPQRESTVLLRTITGTLFGVFTAWFMYPRMEESIKESSF